MRAMYHHLADRQIVPFNTAPGGVVTMPAPMNGGNSVLLCVTVIQVLHTQFCMAGIQLSDDRENWEFDTVNTLYLTALGYFEKRITGIGAKWVRVTYFTDSLSTALVAVALDVADL